MTGEKYVNETLSCDKVAAQTRSSGFTSSVEDGITVTRQIGGVRSKKGKRRAVLLKCDQERT